MKRNILLPLNIFYGTAILIRNLLYKSKFFKSTSFNLPVICIGNITVGGTGKTPHVEYLISLLEKDFTIAVLSRGYKRKTKGYLLSDVNSTTKDIGDEPFQIKQNYPNTIVAVDEKRVRGVANLIKSENPNVILLDDAFQHRAIKPSFSIVLVDYNRPIFKDKLLPAGNLREPKKSIQRASIVIVTKCPKKITAIDKKLFKLKLKLYPYQKLFFTYFDYGKPYSVNNNSETEIKNKDILLVTGIANTTYLEKYLKEKCNSLQTIKYNDHHDYSISDIAEITKTYNSIKSDNKIIIITEKDKVKLLEIKKEIKNTPFFCLPIKVKFVGGSDIEFNKLIIRNIKKNKHYSF